MDVSQSHDSISIDGYVLCRKILDPRHNWIGGNTVVYVYEPSITMLSMLMNMSSGTPHEREVIATLMTITTRSVCKRDKPFSLYR